MAFDDLRQLQAKAGATLGAEGTVLSFARAEEAIAAARTGVALADRSHWGRIRVRDGDRLKFLHNQTTNDFQSLKPGQGCETVFVTSTARTIDLVSAYVLEDEVLLLVSPGQVEPLMKFCDRYIFFDDAVKLVDGTEAIACFTLIGPKSHAIIQSLTAQDLSQEPLHHHRRLQMGELALRLAIGSDLGLPGYNLFCEAAQAALLWQRLSDASAVPMGAHAWEQLRVEQGRPAAGQELTEDYNPLEAGLWQTISFDKGCYIGQETIARLNTYNGVKQRLFGLKVEGDATAGTVLMAGENKVGTLTSVVETTEGRLGLAYVRTKLGGEGLVVRVGDGEASLVRLPYTHHPESSASG